MRNISVTLSLSNRSHPACMRNISVTLSLSKGAKVMLRQVRGGHVPSMENARRTLPGAVPKKL